MKASNPLGTANTKAHLVIETPPSTPIVISTAQATLSQPREEAPEFKALVNDANVGVREPVTFDCTVVGTPMPEVFWQKDGRRLPETSTRWKFIAEDHHHTLVIFECQPFDAGVYECVAINSAGKATCTANLNVDGKKTSSYGNI